MNSLKIEASVDLHKSDYAVFDVLPHVPYLDVNLVGFEITRPDYKLSRKTFSYFALELVTKGKGTLRLKGSEYPLGPGSIFTYGPGIPHRIESDRHEPLEKYFIDLTLQATLFDSPINEPGMIFKTSRTNRLASLLRGLLEDATNGVDDERIRRTTAHLFLDLASLDIHRENPVNTRSYQTYLAVKTFIDQNHHQIGSLVELATAMNFDSSYLSRLFKRYSNEPPYQYLMRIRLSRACYLLKRHDMQIQEISKTLGFSDPFHFSTVFKRHIGVSPRAYRAKCGPDPTSEESKPASV